MHHGGFSVPATVAFLFGDTNGPQAIPSVPIASSFLTCINHMSPPPTVFWCFVTFKTFLILEGCYLHG